MKAFQSQIGNKIDQIAAEINLITIVLDLKYVKDELFYLLKQICNGNGLFKVSFEELFLVRVIGIVVDIVNFALHMVICYQFAHILNLRQIRDDRMKINF